jgi:predicted nucleotidyltransferase
MLDLTAGQLAVVRDILHRHVPGLAVRAFGSRVNGTARHYSDLDLAIIAATPLPFDLIGRLREDFSESGLPFRVDILDWATTGEPFRRIVEQDSVVIQPGPDASREACIDSVPRSR